MPRYDTVQEEGPDHEKTFGVEVYVGDVRIGSGRGASKKEAEQKAAAEALSRYPAGSQSLDRHGSIPPETGVYD